MLPCIHKQFGKITEYHKYKMAKTIPKFPKFRPFTIKDSDWYYEYYISQGINPYADLHPENMIAWLNMKNDLMISDLNDTLIIKYTNVLNDNKFNIIPIANSISDKVIEDIMKYLKQHNLPLEIREIPSKICDKLDKNKWIIEDDRDSYEYILDTRQQCLMNGKYFSDQRRRIKLFEKEHAKDKIEILYYKKFNNQIKKAFLKHIKTMPMNNNPFSAANNINEPIAIKNNMKYASQFGKKALIIKINGKITSLGLVSYLDNDTAGGNHLKVDYSIKYIFYFTVYQLSKILEKDNIGEINIEQDLGIEGLRSFKEHLPPSRFLEKKTIKPLSL